ncbi:NAD-dependent epimerase/dehydratase family protein [Halomonas icarae]|uniref:NAD-dependent epimerase/dehydratase family protein n=1 Tax=Halomonas icarae TaxID=2691040 RepID=A0A7X4VYT2_9GAMM|nr:NAD(P)-dependent oxidoreductase [Halomonas icarae]MDR5903557.1 NAD(P)-dependent oxidoreductase [Halomonas icarae]NAW12847.1 NAD-dependent epimerase/dehydratase family protein [Halomonas icarae]
MEKPFNRILITGAAGRLGSELRKGLAPLSNNFRLVDRVEITDIKDNEEAFVFDLADEFSVDKAVEGVEAIIHFGGAPLERPWDEILDSNIRGSYNIYESARRHGIKRVIYASSVHAIGYHKIDDNIDCDAKPRPDSLYGVSKNFVESLSSLYWDKFGIESACIRIFSSFPEPADRRMLWSWLSFDDCVRLVSACLTAPHIGHTITAGISDNKVKPINMDNAGHIGYVPHDSAEPYRESVESKTKPADPMDPATHCIGGWFVNLGHPNDEESK